MENRSVSESSGSQTTERQHCAITSENSDFLTREPTPDDIVEVKLYDTELIYSQPATLLVSVIDEVTFLVKIMFAAAYSKILDGELDCSG